MSDIKFGTDGWRAIIADDFTVNNVKRVAAATAIWINSELSGGSAIVGYDCRFGGKLFAETTARVLASHGIKVWLSTDFVSTPMVSLATLKQKASCGIIITASHNPPSYNGFKIKGNYGGPALPEMIETVEKNIPDAYRGNFETLEELTDKGLIQYLDMETMYQKHAESHFDMAAINNSGIRIGYDGMYGAGQRVTAKLLPKATMFHCDFNPSFHGQAPEPILKNLQEIAGYIKANKNIDFAFATDGDADRIGVLDSDGNFVDSHHLILILINYLNKNKGLKGKIVNSFSCTSRIGKMCQAYGLENIVTKIGFKYICGIMISDDVLIGAEESGGIAVANHIPERDGVWIALTILEYMAKSGKSLADLIKEVYDVVGTFSMERYDLHVEDEEKQRIVNGLKSRQYQKFGKYTITGHDDLDGFKCFLDNGSWVMARASGTEPVLRLYAEANTYAEAIKILDATKATLFDSIEV
jgi:phosphomannomutase